MILFLKILEFNWLYVEYYYVLVSVIIKFGKYRSNWKGKIEFEGKN